MCISLLFAAYMIIYTRADAHILTISVQKTLTQGLQNFSHARLQNLKAVLIAKSLYG